DLVFTAFSGSHQDAIKKGFAARRDGENWQVPYLPIDPADLGRTYEEVIRVNSQSGKGGISFLLERDYGLALPRRLQIEFSGVVQRQTDASGREMTSSEIHEVFRREYLERRGPFSIVHHHIDEDSHRARSVSLAVDMLVDGRPVALSGTGGGPVEAFVNALALPLVILDYHEHAIGAGAKAVAPDHVEVRYADGDPVYGVGLDGNSVTASLEAIVSALNRSGCGAVDVAAIAQSA